MGSNETYDAMFSNRTSNVTEVEEMMADATWTTSTWSSETTDRTNDTSTWTNFSKPYAEQTTSYTMSSAASEKVSSADWITQGPGNESNYFSEISINAYNNSFVLPNVSDGNMISEIIMDYNHTLTTLDVNLITTMSTVFSFPNSEIRADISIEELVLKTLSLALIAITGLAANGFIIFTIVKEGSLHRPPFYYVLSLCVSDLSRSVFCIPLVLMTVLQGSLWKHGHSACKVFAFANSFFVYSSSAAILAISIDRHFSTVYFKMYKRRSRGLVNLSVVVVGWTIAFAMSFPPVVGLGSYVFVAEESQCTFHHRYYKHNDTLGFMMVFSLIVFMSMFLYMRVFSFLRGHRKMRPLEHQPARSANWTFFGPGANGQALVNIMNGFGANPALNPLRVQARPNYGRVVNLHTLKNEHLTRLFFVVTCVFCGLWFPYIVLAFWRIFSETGKIIAVFQTIAAWLTYTQVAVCPLVYILSRGPIRKHSRTVVDANDKQEFLLEARHRK